MTTLADSQVGIQSRTDPPHIPRGPHVGELLVTKGKHAGKRLDACPPDFLLWLVERSTSPVFKRAAAELLGIENGPRRTAATIADLDATPDRRARPVFLTDAALDEILGVLFMLADEVDSLRQRVAELEAARANG